MKNIHISLAGNELIVRLAPKPKKDVLILGPEHKGEVYDSSYAYVY